MNSPIRVLAYYLPQFHRIAENDEWWGEGFTEWTNTRKSKPLFAGHYQPRIPQDGHYYDLSDVRVMISQARLARAYGIYGFCYYHYWFNGRRLLEQPLENMLACDEVDIPFCMSWANEPWSRTWDGRPAEIVMAQEYGDKGDWERHFECLVRFFRDSRYIKVDGRPVFVIYRTSTIPRAGEMVDLWDTLAKRAGFRGLYVAETLNTFQAIPNLERSDAVVEFEPMLTLGHYYFGRERALARMVGLLRYGGLNTKTYDSVWKAVSAKPQASYGGRDVFPGIFPDWDNSPRKGERALILRGASPERFRHHVRERLRAWKCCSENTFVFLNAWNEWAEGAYVEPDTRHGLGYLEAIRDVVEEFGPGRSM